jgi:probable HAF family extracellular repeat protein
MRGRTRKKTFGILVLFCTCATSHADWTIVPLAGPKNTDAQVFDVNDDGLVAGIAVDSSGCLAPAVWYGQQAVIIAEGSSSTISPISLNGAGQVAGWMTLSTSSAAFVYAEGRLRLFQSGDDPTILPAAINDAGVVAGVLPSGVAATMDSTTGTITQFGRYGGVGAAFTAISNSGLLAGTISYPGRANTQAFTTSHGAIQMLQGLGGTAAAPTAVNDTDIVVGQASDPAGRYEAVLWQNTTLSVLPVPVGVSDSIANDINNTGETVGIGWVESGTRALLWSGGQVIDLNTLLPSGSPWVLTSATGINDLGQVVGDGTYNGQSIGFLLTPDGVATSIIPEPATYALPCLATGLLFMGRRGRVTR